jgi:hypothetical protein
MLTQIVGHFAVEWGDDLTVIQQETVDNFGDIQKSMRTLFVVMTLSNWDKVAETLTQVMPLSVVYPCAVLYIAVTWYTGASLITGIITESLVRSQQDFKDRKLTSFDKKRKEVYNDLIAFLSEMHEDEMDAHGCVDHEDLKTSLRGDTELLHKLAMSGIVLDETGLLTLINNMSRNGKEKINLPYFADKLTNLVGPSTASSAADLKYELAKIHQKLDALAAKQFPGELIFEPKEQELEPPPVYVAPPIPQGRRPSLCKNRGNGSTRASTTSANGEDKKLSFAATPE